MKTLSHPLLYVLVALLMGSCSAEIWIEDDYVAETPWQTQDLLESYDLWYVDVHATRGPGQIPFVQAAFTLSFDRGTLMANNNLVGIGKTGGGLGIPVGTYAPMSGAVEIAHDLDGLWELEVYVEGPNAIELYDPRSDTSYVLRGYSRNSFDYDGLFYDNIHYFLQEYEAWERIYTEVSGGGNPLGAESYLAFLPDGLGDYFRTSVDRPGTALSALQWDYEGAYTVYDVPGDRTLKTITFDYDNWGSEYFELYVLDDTTVELYHPDSGALYEFRGRGLQTFLKDGDGRKMRTSRKLPQMEVRRQRPL